METLAQRMTELRANGNVEAPRDAHSDNKELPVRWEGTKRIFEHAKLPSAKKAAEKASASTRSLRARGAADDSQDLAIEPQSTSGCCVVGNPKGMVTNAKGVKVEWNRPGAVPERMKARTGDKRKREV